MLNHYLSEHKCEVDLLNSKVGCRPLNVAGFQSDLIYFAVSYNLICTEISSTRGEIDRYFALLSDGA